MKRLLVCLFIIEIMLIGVTCYFLIKWDQPISNGGDHATVGIFSFMFHAINLIVTYIVFSKYTNKYPKNNPSEFPFDPKKSQLGHQGNGSYLIELEEVEKGIWETRDAQEKMRFDMSGYMCPKQYICTYFIRNIHYIVINRNKYPLIKLFKSLKLHPFSKYQNVEISFSYGKKTHKRKIVKNNKTNVTWLMRFILCSKYYIDFIFRLSVGELRKNRVKMTEEMYRNGRH